MTDEDAMRLIAAIVQKSFDDLTSGTYCYQGKHKLHSVATCASGLVDGIYRYIETTRDETPDGIALEVLRLAEREG